MPEGIEQTVSPQRPAAEQPAQPHVSMLPEEARKIVEEKLGALRRMRYFRRQYDSRRALFYRQYLGQRDQRMFPDNVTPRSNTFVPYPFSNVETIVSRVLDAFFSNDPWFETRGRTEMDEDSAERMQLVAGYKLRQSKFVCEFEQLVRNICIYGHAGIKVDWDWDYDVVTYPEPVPLMIPVLDEQGQPVLDPSTGQPAQQPVPDPETGQPVIVGYRPARKVVPRARPKFTAIDVYDLLVEPDRRIVAQLTERTWRQLQKEMEQNPQAYFPEGMAELAQRLAGEKESDSILIRLAEIWDETDNTWTVMTFGEDAEAISWKDLRASYRAASYSPYKRRVYGGPSILLFHGENPFAHKRCPILHTSFTKLPNEVYGLGAVEIISDLSEAMNRFSNMIVDNWNISINRRYAYDINADIDHEALNSFNVPGGKVGVSGDPNKVIAPLPFFTPAPGDYAVLDLYKNMIELATGISDFYAKGIGTPGPNRTATGISQIIGESNYRFRMLIRNLELDILQPLLEMTAALIQQFVTDEQEIQITDAPPGIPKWGRVAPEELIGSFSFDIVAANYAQNKIMRQRNLMALANVLSDSPYLREREALVELLRAFEIRNVNRLLKTPEEVASEQEAQQQRELQLLLLQHYLDVDTTVRKAAARPSTTRRAGSRAKAQFEGKLPGAGVSSMIRDLAQGLGANAVGMSGMGEVNAG